jgi:hypothetical protein
VLPIAWYLVNRKPLRQLAWLHKLTSDKTKSKQLAPSDPITEGEILRSYGLLAAPLLGWAAYFGLMWAWTGNPFEGIEAQRFWRAHSISNLINVPKFVIGFFTPTVLHDFRGSMLDRWLFILLLCTLPLVWRAGKDLLIWTYVLGILPAMSGTFTSFTRYASTVFPMFIALAVFFTSLKYKWPLVLFIILSVTLHVVLLWRFVNFRWAG